MQSRFQSGALWVTLALLLISLLTQTGFGWALPVGLDVFITGVVTLFATLGIVNNPKTGRWFFAPGTPWKKRLRSTTMWLGLIAVFASLVAQILKWFNVAELPFDLNQTLMTFLAILQATGIIDGTPPLQDNPAADITAYATSGEG